MKNVKHVVASLTKGQIYEVNGGKKCTCTCYDAKSKKFISIGITDSKLNCVYNCNSRKLVTSHCQELEL